MSLTSKQIRHLRALAHHLDAVVHMGKDGLTEAFTRAIDQGLTDHELLKVKLNAEAPDKRHAVAAALAPRVGAELVQVLGRTIILYRKHPKKPVITLPVAD